MERGRRRMPKAARTTRDITMTQERRGAASGARRARLSGTVAAAPLAALAPALLAALATGCGSSNPTGTRRPPTVALTTPLPGVAVSPVGFLARATASDDRGVARVEFAVDDAVVASVSSAPYQAFLTSLGLDSTRTHTVRATAYDTDGLSASASALVSVKSRRYRQLTNSSGARRNTEPAWDPFGNEIAYASQGTVPNAPKNIFVLSAFGPGTPLQLTFSARQDGNPSYSPDRSWIAFESDRTTLYQIYAVHRGTLATVQLTTTGANQRRPAWGAPVGGESWIAYESDRGNRDDIYMVKVAAGPDTISILVPDSPGTPADANPSIDLAPTWSEAGLLAINSNRAGGSFAVLLVDPFLPIAPITVLGTNQFLVETDAASFSPLDESLAFVDQSTALKKVFVVPVQGPGSIRYEAAPAGLGGNAWDPAWSPDGGRIAFVSDRTGTPEIWILESTE